MGCLVLYGRNGIVFEHVVINDGGFYRFVYIQVCGKYNYTSNKHGCNKQCPLQSKQQTVQKVNKVIYIAIARSSISLLAWWQYL